MTDSLNTLAWFEVATDDPDTAVAFYGDLFGWTFAPFADPAEAGMDYRIATQPTGGPPFGGILNTGGAMPAHATFSFAVADVGDVCLATEKLGGTVVQKELEPTGRRTPTCATRSATSSACSPPCRVDGGPTQ